MQDYKFRKLRADEISPRIGRVGDGWATLLLYKTSRVDADILNETVGCLNWQIEQRVIKDVLYAGISIWDGNKSCWVTKWSAGAETTIESEKGEDSDAMKRSAFRWGIGTELYTGPDVIFIKAKEHYLVDNNGKPSLQNRFSVTHIAYDEDGHISELEIYNNKLSKVIFKWESDKAILEKSEKVRKTLVRKALANDGE